MVRDALGRVRTREVAHLGLRPDVEDGDTAKEEEERRSYELVFTITHCEILLLTAVKLRRQHGIAG